LISSDEESAYYTKVSREIFPDKIEILQDHV